MANKTNYNIKNLIISPNTITIFRIFLSFPLILALNYGNYKLAILIIIIGGISDFLDGWVARKYNLKSELGSKLDPLADKIFHTGPLIWFAQEGIIPIWAIYFLICRELLISSLRSESNKSMPASYIAKLKTSLQFIYTLIIIYYFYIDYGNFNEFILGIGLILFWISFAFAIISGIRYFKDLIVSDLD